MKQITNINVWQALCLTASNLIIQCNAVQLLEQWVKNEKKVLP